MKGERDSVRKRKVRWKKEGDLLSSNLLFFVRCGSVLNVTLTGGESVVSYFYDTYGNASAYESVLAKGSENRNGAKFLGNSKSEAESIANRKFMKSIKFERELKSLMNKVRAYGIQHISYTNPPRKILENKEKQSEFIQKVHKGFSLAQRDCILLLKQVLMEKKRYKAELKLARQDRNKAKCDEIMEMQKLVKYQEMCLRKIMDAIAWQIFNSDLSAMRRLYYGQEWIDITDSNLDSEITFAEQYISKNPEAFVLISDLTSFIQIGDVVIFTPGDGVAIAELKEGKENAKVFELIEEFAANDCIYGTYQRLTNETKKFQEQFLRDIKQMERSNQAVRTINSGEGRDLFTDLDVKIYSDKIILDTYAERVERLLEESDKKGHAISVVEGCLLVGVYKNGRFPVKAFDVWTEALNIKMPVIDFRQAMFDPLAYPIYLQPFAEKHILDIVLGKKIVKFTLDLEKWLETFKKDGLEYRWLSKKETARINGKFKGRSALFSIDGCGIEIKSRNGAVQYIGEGIFSRMFTGLNTPSSLKKVLTAIFDRQEEESLAQVIAPVPSCASQHKSVKYQ